MATSTGSRALDFALGIGAYSPEIDMPESMGIPEGGIASALHRGSAPAGPVSKSASAIAPLAKAAAEKYNIPYGLLMGMIQQESSFNPNATGPETRYGRAKGLAQLIDSTAKRYGVDNPYDPRQAVEGGAHYLRDLLHRYNGNQELAVAAYNTGEGNVDKMLRGQGRLAAETQNYVPRVMQFASQFEGGAAPAAAPPAAPAQATTPGMRLVTLTDGTQMEAPEGLDDAQVFEHLRKSQDPAVSQLMPARPVEMDGVSQLVPFNMQNEDEIRHHLVNAGVLPDPTEGKGGRAWGNVVSGFERSIGNYLTGLGYGDEAKRFYDAAKAGEYQMYESEVEAAKRKGFLPGIAAEAKQNLLYPGAEMLGQFAPAMLPIGGGALGAAAKVAAMYPAARGEILHRGEEEGKPVSPEDATLYGLPLAAVETVGLPLRGAGRLIGREAEEAAIKSMVARGAVEEAEKKALGSVPMDIAKSAAVNFAKNVGAMGAMEGLQKGAMGEPMLPQTPEELAQLAEAAAWFAGPHAALEGMGARGRREEALQRATAQREPVGAPETKAPATPEVLEPEAIGEPMVTPPVETKSEMQSLGEAYGRHVMDAEARGEPPMSPDEFVSQFKTEIAPEVSDELAPGDIEAVPSSEIIQPSPFQRKHKEAPSAEQITEAGAPDGGGRPQPEVRPESGAVPKGGEGVQPSGQGVKAPEVGREEIKVPEAKVAPTPKTKAPKGELRYIPKDELERMPEEQRVAYHQERGAQLKSIPWNKAGALPERDRLDKYQYHGLSNKEIAEKMGLSGPEETVKKLEEHGLQNMEVELNKPMSEQRRKYLEAQQEERAKYREASAEEPPKAEETREDYWRENPYSPDDKQSWQDTFGYIHHDLDHALPSGAKIKEVIDQRASGRVTLRMDTPSGEKFFPLHIVHPADPNSTAPSRLYWKSTIDGKDITEQGARKTFGDDLYDALYKHEGKEVENQDQVHDVVNSIVSDVRSLSEKKGKKKAEAKAEPTEYEKQELERKQKEESRKKQEEEDDEYFKEYEKEDEEGVYELPEFDYTEPDRELDYSKGKAAPDAHTPETLEKHLTEAYGARRPAVNVTTREAAKAEPNVKAFYEPKTKKVYLVADNIGKGDNIHGLLKHEIGVHAQRLGLKDPEFQGILKHMRGMHDSNNKIVREAYAKVPKDTRPERVHEEALGYLVEHHPNLPLVRRFMSWLRRMAHKLTGNAGWLKPEDLSHMAHRILKRDYGVESRPERANVQGEKLRSARDDNLRAIDETGIIKTEKKLGYKEAANEYKKGFLDSLKNFRVHMVDTTDPLTKKLQSLPTFNKEMGKFRADIIASEANQAVGLVGHALENGYGVINKSGALMVIPDKANLVSVVNRAAAKEKGGDKLLSYVLRVNIGEHRIKEHEQDIKDIARLDREIGETKSAIKFHKSLNQLAEYRKAEKRLKEKESAKKLIMEAHNIDPETMEGREKLVDANMIALRDKIMKDHEWLKPLVEDTYKAMDHLVDFQLQAGMIDKLTAEKWKAAPYVPLYKSLADLEKDPNFGKMFARSAEALSEVKQIKGFKHSVNMLENLHKHYYGMMLPAVFNHVRKEAVGQMLHIDATEMMRENPGLSYEKALAKATKAIERPKGGPGTVKVMENGEAKHYYIEDPDLLEMMAFNRPEIGGFSKAFRPAAGLLRVAYLKNPAFWAKQLFAEPIYANFLAGNKNLIHPGQAVGNLMKIWLGTSEGAKVLERHGVDVGYHAFGGKKAFSYEEAGEATKFHDLVGKKTWVRKAMDKLDRIHNSVDEAVRVSVYDAAVKDGKELGLKGQDLEDFAVNKARTFINFSARGKSQLVNEYRAATAFSSAAINGLDAIMKNATGYGLNKQEAARVKGMFRKRLMAGTAIGTGLALLEMTENPQAGNESDLYEKLTTFRIPGTDVKAPTPWDLGAVTYGIPKLILMATAMDDLSPYSVTQGKAFKGFLELMYKNVLPPVPIPSAITPTLEAITNYSFDNLKPLESAGAQMMAPDARGRMNTYMGEAVGNLLGISGKRADHIGRGYLGKIYDVVNGLADMATDRYEGRPVSKYDLVKKAGLGQFVVDETRVSGADMIYDAFARSQQEVNAFSKYRVEDKEKLKEFMADPERMAYKRAAPMLRGIHEQLSAIERQITLATKSNQPVEAQRAKVTQLNERKRAIIDRGNLQIRKTLGQYAP